MLGSAFAYVFARLVGRPVIQKLIGAKRIEKIDHVLASSKGRSALFLLFLVPGMPKDSLSFGVGLTDFRFAEFIVLSGLGRAPALLVSTMIGSQVHARDYTSIAITVVVAGLVIGAAYFYEKRRSAT